MAEARRGTAALLLTAGDPEISGTLADGIMAVRGAKDLIRLDAERRATFPDTKLVSKIGRAHV